MIIDFKINFNNYKQKILDNYSNLYYSCPKCGANHSLIRHGTYDRNLILLDASNIIRELKFNVLRVKCKSCGSTHTILPNDIIPYCIYSFSFIITLLSKRYIYKEKITDISENLSVSFQMIYFFISKILKFLDSASIVLRNLGSYCVSNLSSIIKFISTYNKFNNFSYQYFFFTRRVFLMSKFHYVLSPPVYFGAYS